MNASVRTVFLGVLSVVIGYYVLRVLGRTTGSTFLS